MFNFGTKHSLIHFLKSQRGGGGGNRVAIQDINFKLNSATAVRSCLFSSWLVHLDMGACFRHENAIIVCEFRSSGMEFRHDPRDVCAQIRSVVLCIFFLFPRESSATDYSRASLRFQLYTVSKLVNKDPKLRSVIARQYSPSRFGQPNLNDGLNHDPFLLQAVVVHTLSKKYSTPNHPPYSPP